MEPSRCEFLCSTYGFRFFGLQFGSECYCGDSYGRYGKANERECKMKCKGSTASDQYCGGDLRNSVYEVTVS